MFEPRIIDFNERLNNLYEFILDLIIINQVTGIKK